MIRLFELREEKGLSQRAIAKILNISQGTYNNWENSNTQPSIEQLIELSKFFNVSVDYLIGNADELGIINVQEQLRQDQIDLINKYEKLSDVAKKNLIFFLNEISK